MIKLYFHTEKEESLVQDSFYTYSSLHEIILYNTITSFSMKSVRPLTAQKKNRHLKQEAKTVISRFNRPATAKSTSLKQIIQVIQNTLNKGAHTILNKAKTLDKFSKVRHHFNLTQLRKYKYTTYVEREIPQFNTQFLIQHQPEIIKSPPLAKSSKKIIQGPDNAQFVPYKNKGIGKAEQNSTRPQNSGKFANNPKPLIKQGKCRIMKQRQKQVQEVDIDRWQNEPSILHLSFLLHNGKIN